MMSSQAETILLFENDQDTRELYARELGRYFNVKVCTKLNEALTILQKYEVRAIILEPVSNGDQGWAFLAILKNLTEDRPIPVILCSTLDEPRLAFELGASCYLIKPILPTQLCNVTRHFIHNTYLNKLKEFGGNTDFFL